MADDEDIQLTVDVVPLMTVVAMAEVMVVWKLSVLFDAGRAVGETKSLVLDVGGREVDMVNIEVVESGLGSDVGGSDDGSVVGGRDDGSVVGGAEVGSVVGGDVGGSDVGFDVGLEVGGLEVGGLEVGGSDVGGLVGGLDLYQAKLDEIQNRMKIARTNLATSVER